MIILNPAILYSTIWLLVLFLYSFGLSGILHPLQTSTIILVVGTSISFITGWLIESIFYRCKLALPMFNLEMLSALIGSDRVGNRLKIAWLIFFIGILFEIFYFGGAPGLGLIGMGPLIYYADFGIPGFHGLINSLFYACCILQFSRIILGLTGSYFFLLLISLSYPIVCMSRQIFISLFLQYLLAYFGLRRPTMRIYLSGIALVSGILLIFGYVGDIRSGRDAFISLADPTFSYPDWLPSALIWVYIYVTTPLNNVNYNIDISPNIFPLETLGTFIPSFARDEFMSAVGANKSWNLVIESFNVNSLLQSFLSDFGVVGSILFTLMCGFFLTRVMRNAANSPATFFYLIVLLHGLALSFFANLLFHLVFMFQILIIGLLLGRRWRI